MSCEPSVAFRNAEGATKDRAAVAHRLIPRRACCLSPSRRGLSETGKRTLWNASSRSHRPYSWRSALSTDTALLRPGGVAIRTEAAPGGPVPVGGMVIRDVAVHPPASTRRNAGKVTLKDLIPAPPLVRSQRSGSGPSAVSGNHSIAQSSRLSGRVTAVNGLSDSACCPTGRKVVTLFSTVRFGHRTQARQCEVFPRAAR